jgi:hypothetical protein
LVPTTAAPTPPPTPRSSGRVTPRTHLAMAAAPSGSGRPIRWSRRESRSMNTAAGM